MRYIARMWPFNRKQVRDKSPQKPLFFTNTLTGIKEQFDAPKHRVVRMYNCGPTVYDTQHIGNLSMYVFVDVLRRTLEYNGMEVKQVINITDVGHLTSDADEGEDKMSKGLRATGKELTLENMKWLGEMYAEQFMRDLRALNVQTKDVEFPRASDYIPAQIALIQTLVEKEYAYQVKDGVYFDTSAFPEYGKLGGIHVSTLKKGARVAVVPEKRNPADFALWKRSDALGWNSPWGKGFPGWHIECSAMARSLLGEQIDIHTGGVEHIPVHHNNEIAQSEAASGKKPFARFWLHRAHIQLEGQKLAKSENRVVYLSDIVKKGFHPLAYRYLLLGAHYRTPLNFTWEALEGASHALTRLHALVRRRIESDAHERMALPEAYCERFHERINDDLDTPGALAVLWDMLKDEHLRPAEVAACLADFDRVFGLKVAAPDKSIEKILSAEYGQMVPSNALSHTLQVLIQKREHARKENDWKVADALRGEIERAGYTVKDTADGPVILKK